MFTAFMVQSQGEGQVGRPLKFGEPLKRREFKLPESMGERLTLEARRRGRDVSDIVREAIQAEFDKADKKAPTETADNKTATLEGLTELPASLREEIQRAVQAAFSEAVRSSGMQVKLSKKEQEGLRAFSASLGYMRPEELVEDMARRALEKEHQPVVEEMIFGKGRRAVAEQRKQLEAEITVAKSKKSKAA